MCEQEEVNIFVEIIKSPVLSAIIAAITATLISPFIKWRIEKIRNQLNKRGGLISDVRAFFNELNWDSFIRFNESKYVHQLLPFLPKETKSRLNNVLDNYPEVKKLLSVANPGFITIDKNITDKLRESVLNSIPEQERNAKNKLLAIATEYLVLRDKIYEELADLERKWKLL